MGELHLAGHARDGDLLIDTHGTAVDAAVWELFAHVIARIGPVPTLIEWDTDPPAFHVLMQEAGRAGAMFAAPLQVAA